MTEFFEKQDVNSMAQALNESFLGNCFTFTARPYTDGSDGLFRLCYELRKKDVQIHAQVALGKLVHALSNLEFAGLASTTENTIESFGLKDGQPLHIEDDPHKIEQALNKVRADLIAWTYTPECVTSGDCAAAVSVLDQLIVGNGLTIKPSPHTKAEQYLKSLHTRRDETGQATARTS